jgi:SAM-dependent methyltransferase
MHDNNRRWLADLTREHPAWFTGGSILELGSAGADPEIRNLFTNTANYVGVDLVDGPNVDVVGNAATVDFGKTRFDVVICFSMLEHDENWRESLGNAEKFLKQGGVMIGCHGAEGNLHHGPEPWRPVWEQDFLDQVDHLYLQVVEAFFEEERYGPDCAGAYDWILRKP